MMAALLLRLAPYKLLFEILVIGGIALAVVGGIVSKVHDFAEHHEDIGAARVQALWDAQTARDKEAARIETARLAQQSAEAEKNGATREQTIRTLAAAAGSANLSLHDALAAVNRNVPGATVETLGNTVATLSTIFADCAGRYQGLAEKADRHASDAQTLSDAWPTPSSAKP